MKELTLRKVAPDLLEFTPPIILDESQTTRRSFFGQLAQDANGVWNLRGTIIAERKGTDGWHRQTGVSLSKLKGGEIAKLELRREHLRNFVIGLEVLANAAKVKGIDLKGVGLIVGRKDEVVHVGRKHKDVIEELIRANHGGEFWEVLAESRPQLALELAEAQLLKRRRGAQAEFERELLAGRWDERAWESFFRQNEWIFGIGLRFQFLTLLRNQANFGGAGFDRKGEQKGEFLMHTEAESERFTVLVEIKRPDTRFFAEKPYRSGVPGFNPEFMNAISQVQVNSSTWEHNGSKQPRDAEKLAQAHIRTISPRAILVYGHTGELDTYEKRNAFELLRSHLRTPEILTFDELCVRARFIVRNPEQGR